MGVVVGRHLNYLGRLRERMQRRGFPHDDPLVGLVTASWEATHSLSVRLHYLSVASVLPIAHHETPPVQHPPRALAAAVHGRGRAENVSVSLAIIRVDG